MNQTKQMNQYVQTNDPGSCIEKYSSVPNKSPGTFIFYFFGQSNFHTVLKPYLVKFVFQMERRVKIFMNGLSVLTTICVIKFSKKKIIKIRMILNAWRKNKISVNMYHCIFF